MKEILKLLGENFARRIRKQMGLNLAFTEEAYDYILKKGKDTKYGARPLKRALQSMLEDPLADAILAGTIDGNREISVKVQDENLIFE